MLDMFVGKNQPTWCGDDLASLDNCHRQGWRQVMNWYTLRSSNIATETHHVLYRETLGNWLGGFSIAIGQIPGGYPSKYTSAGTYPGDVNQLYWHGWSYSDLCLLFVTLEKSLPIISYYCLVLFVNSGIYLVICYTKYVPIIVNSSWPQLFGSPLVQHLPK